MAKTRPNNNDTAGNVGSGAQLRQLADALRGSMDAAAEYKHAGLGLLFLKSISDAFKEKRAALVAETDQGAGIERDNPALPPGASPA